MIAREHAIVGRTGPAPVTLTRNCLRRHRDPDRTVAGDGQPTLALDRCIGWAPEQPGQPQASRTMSRSTINSPLALIVTFI